MRVRAALFALVLWGAGGGAACSAATAQVRPAPDMVSLPTGSTLATWQVKQDTAASAGTMVFLHGGPGLYTEDRRIDEAAVFRKAGYATLFFDQAGSGQSAKLKASDYSLNRAVADLEAVRASRGLDKMLLWGNSFGANLAILYAQQYPDRVSAIILTSPGIFPGMAAKRDYSRTKRNGVEIGKDLSKAAARIDKEGAKAEAELSQIETGKLLDAITQSELIDAMTCKASTVALPKLPGGGNLFVNRMLQAELKMSKRDWSKLPKVPSLIIRGDCDFLPVKSAEAYKAALNAEYAAIPGAGHALLEDRAAVDSALQSFIERRLAAAKP
jgi:pimeloyl-ACP methyl ester carboxylesterase